MTLRELMNKLMGGSKLPVNGLINAALKAMMPKVPKGEKDPMDYEVLINGERVDTFVIEQHPSGGFIDIVTRERLSSGENSETEALSDITSEGRSE